MIEIEELISYIKKIFEDYKFEIVNLPLVLAIIEQESSFEPYAIRYEPKLSNKYIQDPKKHKPKNCSYDTEVFLQKCSFGLMQIMGFNARVYGMTGWLTKLFSPFENLTYGIKHLDYLENKRKIKNLERLMGAYNGQNNEQYVRSVMTRYEKFLKQFGR